jgi:hypothetical protein
MPEKSLTMCSIFKATADMCRAGGACWSVIIFASYSRYLPQPKVAFAITCDFRAHKHLVKDGRNS